MSLGFAIHSVAFTIDVIVTIIYVALLIILITCFLLFLYIFYSSGVRPFSAEDIPNQPPMVSASTAIATSNTTPRPSNVERLENRPSISGEIDYDSKWNSNFRFSDFSYFSY